VFENRVLRSMFGQKRVEPIGGWRKVHNEELHNLYPSPHTVRFITSRRMRWVEHEAYMGRRVMYIVSMGKTEETTRKTYT
jgi:hypothetical protein